MSKNIDILTYRIDTLERKLENIERLLLSNQVGPSQAKNPEGITSEILHVLLDMVKMKNENKHSTISNVQNTVQSAEQPSPSSTKQVDNDDCKGDLFGFQRRRSIV